jgi:hypothetical protein
MSLPTLWLKLSSTATVALVLAASTGCSSSSSPAEGGADSGAPHDSSAADRYVASDGPATTKDGASSKDGSVDAGPCPPESTAGFNPTPFVPATAHQGVCSISAINAFINACVMSTSEATCSMWQDMNLPGDGGAGTPCGNCMLPNNTDDNGGLWLDPLGNFWPNYGACIQITDPTHGTACATAYDNLSGCEDVGCDDRCSGVGMCGTSAACEACFSNVGADCSSYLTAAKSACATDVTDGGAIDTCSPSSKTGEQASDFAYIIELVCGGTAADAGHD